MTATQWKMALQVGFTYIGTVVGAGFASGQEVMKFFTVYGPFSFLAILVSTMLFGWLGMKIMSMGDALGAKSFRELTGYLMGGQLARATDWVLSLMLFGVTVAMLAGVGALFQEQLHWPFEAGVFSTMVLAYFTVLRGVKGLLGANTFVVPAMTAFTLYVFLKHFIPHSPYVAGWLPHGAEPVRIGPSLISAVSYAAFNIGLSISILVPLGKEIRDRAVILAGSVIGAAGLGALLAAGNFVFLQHMPQILGYEIPMAVVIGQYQPWVRAAFLAVLWGEIFTTLIANLYGLVAPFPSSRPGRRAAMVFCILIAACGVSYAGFSNIVMYLYPLFGYISFVLLVMLLWPRKTGRHWY